MKIEKSHNRFAVAKATTSSYFLIFVFCFVRIKTKELRSASTKRNEIFCMNRIQFEIYIHIYVHRMNNYLDIYFILLCCYGHKIRLTTISIEEKDLPFL